MEEDIKILECYLDRNTQLFEDYGGNAIIQDKEIQALENLIKGYRELEEENRGLRLDRRNLSNCIEAIKHTTPLNMVSNTDYYIQINDNYIPKSKIQARIDEFEEQIKDSATICAYCKDVMIMKMMQEQIGILKGFQKLLQELMEDK